MHVVYAEKYNLQLVVSIKTGAPRRREELFIMIEFGIFDGWYNVAVTHY